MFPSYMPLSTYSQFSKIYEQEHLYDKALYYAKLAAKYSTINNPYFITRIERLQALKRNPPQRRHSKMSERQAAFEADVSAAAHFFLNEYDN